MSLIHDMTEKIKNWKPENPLYIFAEDHAEKLYCRICGKKYVSRGKNDPGICRECEREQNAHCIGGEYDGQPAHDNYYKGDAK